MKFLDTNVFVRYLTSDDPIKAAACRRLWQQVDQGQAAATTSEAILAEVCYVLSSARLYGLNHEDIAARLRALLSLPGLKIRHKRSFLRALDLYAAHAFLDFENALIVAHMERDSIEELISYDTDFDRVPGIIRVEP